MRLGHWSTEFYSTFPDTLLALRETSRLAELPGNGGSARWVLEMLQPQAASLIILSEAALWSEHRISVVLESELGPEERDLARQTASSSSWGLGISSPMTGKDPRILDYS